jgi:hypothetical protein
MSSQLLVYLAGVALLAGLFFAVKRLSRGRITLSYRAAEGILILAIAAACVLAAYLSGQFS